MCDTCGCNITKANQHLLKPGGKFYRTAEGHEAVTVLKGLLSENDHTANHNRQHFDKHGVLAINLMSSPGSGKTALLEATLDALKQRFRIAVVEGDLMLVAAYEDGLRGYDISDPANPDYLKRTVDGLGPVARVASDGFGHLVTMEGRAAEFTVIRLRLLEDFFPDGPSEVGFKAHYALSLSGTAVGPGDVAVEVFAETVHFTAAEPDRGIDIGESP